MDAGLNAHASRSSRRAGLLSASSLLCIAMLAGCAPATDGTSTTMSPPTDVTVQLGQNRDQYAGRSAIVRVENGSDDDLVVIGLELSGSAFDGATDRDRTSTVPAGQTKDLAVELPPAACGTAASDLRADITLHLEDGAVVTVAAVEDPSAVLPRLHGAECTVVGVERIADITAESSVRLEGSGPSTVAVLTISITPTGRRGRLDLVELRSTVLLKPAPDASAPIDAAAWPLGRTVDATSGPQSIDVRIVPTRCDPHALAEDKVGTLFPLVVRIDGGPEAIMTLPLPAATATALKDAVRIRCG
ncbi:hypothetical protein [Plantibacter sp. LMC-P-059a]|uniref:hypothetical protein n=1 Tax=Plantibacter sp. LMC-P-059a TaxID=3040297 RepID=UPI00254CE2D5|nr:hypothetical protein [Plantibacter sp. LMC-P-059a]